MRGAAAGLALALALAAAGCTPGDRPAAAPGTGGTAPAASTAGQGGPPLRCAPTPLRQGAPPAWTAPAHPPDLPYALGSGDAVAAFFFARPLRAGHPENPANKVLWVVGSPRNRQPLLVTARPAGDAGRAVHLREEADSGPGEIYPSIVDLPSPGCWRLELRWTSHRAVIDVEVQPTAAP
jgi:hypothetical protein